MFLKPDKFSSFHRLTMVSVWSRRMSRNHNASKVIKDHPAQKVPKVLQVSKVLWGHKASKAFKGRPVSLGHRAFKDHRPPKA